MSSDYKDYEIYVPSVQPPKLPPQPIRICYIKDGTPSYESKPFDYKLLILIGDYLCGFVSGLTCLLFIDTISYWR